jgi:hypothetical protein
MLKWAAILSTVTVGAAMLSAIDAHAFRGGAFGHFTPVHRSPSLSFRERILRVCGRTGRRPLISGTGGLPAMSFLPRRASAIWTTMGRQVQGLTPIFAPFVIRD